MEKKDLITDTKTTDAVLCELCNKGIMIPTNEKSSINHCFKCNSCGVYMNVDFADVIVT